MRSTLFVALLAAACGGSHDKTDAAGDGIAITVDTQGTTFDLVAYRDGDTWQMPTATATGFELSVHGPYVVVAVCGTPTYHARTPSDDHTLAITCQKQPPATFNVTGQMVQAGEVGIGPDVDESADPNWSFTVPVEAGTYNVAALTTDRIELRRDVTVSAALAMTPAFDVTAHGMALVPAVFTIVNTTPQETHNASIRLHTTHGDMTVFGGPPNRAKLVPPALLVSGEVHSVALSAGSASMSRTLRRDWHAGDSTAFTLPPALGRAQYTATAAALTATPPELPATFDLARLTVQNTASTELRFTRSYLDAVKMLTIDQDVPGFQAAWKVDFTKPYTASLVVERTEGGDQLTQTTSVAPGVP